ncbi:NAD(P)/FAD-dependent oxidoreductase [Companilactobacillus insicii]|uniref:NAD(P)/FAD-dependent oxidoreductase n=1 Tax=Companilactobacillus insicii TaxID=1732567 RepID=UPI000F77C154|nr:NAD(P)/FAD-dependent oxidoreductase [Companilactobacillus insicii]
MAKKNIVIIGAGFSGVYATKKLAKHFKSNPDVSITLIDKHSYFTYLTELHEVAAERVPENAIQYDLQRLFFNQKNVHLITDTITTIDYKKRIIAGKNGQYPYDYVVLGIGSEPNDFGTPGVKEYGFTLGSWEQAIKLKNHIRKAVLNGSIEQDPEKRASLLSIAVVGSGFTGTETIGEICDWKNSLAHEYKIDPSEIKLSLIEMAPTIMNMMDRKDADKAENYMIKKGINIMKNTGVIGVHDGYIDLKNGNSFKTSTLIWTAGVKANSITSKLGLELSRSGRIAVNETMESKSQDNIFVVGDVSLYDADGSGKGEPQIVQGAEASAQTAVTNIIAKCNSKPMVPYKANYQGFMVSLGSTYGVAFILNKFHLSGFFAIAMKHIVNLMYCIQIFSGYYLIQYMLHEFFRTKNNRNLMFGHISRSGNVLWTVPLRVFLGISLIGINFANISSILKILLTICGTFLIVGLFTCTTGFITFILGIILCSNGYANTIGWIIPTSLACMNGSGRSFGLDKWIVPYIQKKLGKMRYGNVKSIYKSNHN